MKKLMFAASAALAFGLGSPAHAVAVSIPGLFNTGTDASNVALPGGNGVTDPHYVIVTSTSPGFDGNQAVTYYNGAYAADDANSRWISLTGSGTPVNNVTTYRLTFDLTGFDPTTAMVTGSWGADNSAVMLLNGLATGNSVAGFASLTPFTLNSGFASGINMLDFVVTDAGVVTAFRVDDLLGTAQLANNNNVVPEPGTWAMMLIGFAAVGYSVRRSRHPRPAAMAG